MHEAVADSCSAKDAFTNSCCVHSLRNRKDDWLIQDPKHHCRRFCKGIKPDVLQPSTVYKAVADLHCVKLYTWMRAIIQQPTVPATGTCCFRNRHNDLWAYPLVDAQQLHKPNGLLNRCICCICKTQLDGRTSTASVQGPIPSTVLPVMRLRTRALAVSHTCIGHEGVKKS